MLELLRKLCLQYAGMVLCEKEAGTEGPVTTLMAANRGVAARSAENGTDQLLIVSLIVIGSSFVMPASLANCVARALVSAIT